MDDSRFPVEVRIIGQLKKEKCKLYMTSVLWSDLSEVVVYRSIHDFKTLHRLLKKKFHAQTLFRKDRVLPRFGAGNANTNFLLNSLMKSVYQLKRLEAYCSDLLQCDTAILHSTEVTRFFLPNEQELLPEFTQNSVMILQPENIPSVNRGPDLINKRLSAGSVTQPFVTHTYRCVAPYETKDTKNKPFKVTEDERLEVLMKDQAGWWLVENDDKRLAWFPAPYLEQCDEEEDEVDNAFEPETPEMSLYCATRSFSSKKEDELSLSIGAVVEVLQRSDNGWWLVRYNRRAGYVPSMYLQLYRSPTFGLQSLQKKLHSSTINLSTSPGHFLSSQSLEVLPESTRRYSIPHHEECESFSDEGTDFSFSSSDTDSMSPSMSSSDGDENLKQQEKQPTPEISDSGMSRGKFRPNSPETGLSAKTSQAPMVPPRPQTQEIMRRCTTYTRKAAQASSARLANQKICVSR